MSDFDRVADMVAGAAHPIRLRALAAMAAGANSPVAIYDSLHPDEQTLTLALVSHHVGRLAAKGLVEQYATRKVRGATQHLYRLTDEGRALWTALEGLLA